MRAVTLLELITVIVIIGVAATIFAIPQMQMMRESALNQKVKAEGRLLLAAEKQYQLESGRFYVPDQTLNCHNDFIKDNLGLDFGSCSNASFFYWISNASGSTYSCAGGPPTAFISWATRNAGVPNPPSQRYNRYWTISSCYVPYCDNIDNGTAGCKGECNNVTAPGCAGVE